MGLSNGLFLSVKGHTCLNMEITIGVVNLLRMKLIFIVLGMLGL